MTERHPVNPPNWPAPVGYSNGYVAAGRLLFLGGQVAFDETGAVVGRGDLVAQFDRTCANLAAVCETAGCTLEDVVKLTIYVRDRDAYRARGKEIGAAYRRWFGRHFPAMTLVEISRFYEPEVLVEIEGIAVLGD